MEFLLGRDYPHLCDTCRAAIDTAALLLGEEGPDTDNIEAPIDFVYDHSLYCGGRQTACYHPTRDYIQWYFIRVGDDDVEGHGDIAKAIERAEYYRDRSHIGNLDLRLIDDVTGEVLYSLFTYGKHQLREERHGSIKDLRERLGVPDPSESTELVELCKSLGLSKEKS
ncbi:hypothetical protein LCGC14_0275950 [marine sediment metagenome]|uniref:Uncharacterized protein n=1 Tax=marine sediment metagenome TaxID=412755 RepID=A0A0F9X2V7_9ZZZZ